MKTFLLTLVMVLMFSVHCAYHPYAVCYSTGQYKYIGGKPYVKYHCSCGDDVWVME